VIIFSYYETLHIKTDLTGHGTPAAAVGEFLKSKNIVNCHEGNRVGTAQVAAKWIKSKMCIL